MARLAALLVALLALPSLAQADVSFVQSVSVNGASNPFAGDGVADVVLPGATTVNNYIVVHIYVPSNSLSVSSVTQGATALSICFVAPATSATQDSALPHEHWAYCGIVQSASTAVTVTLSSALAAEGEIDVVELAGQNLGRPVEAITLNGNTGVGNHATGNVTSAGAGNVLLGFIGGTSGSYTIDANFTELSGANSVYGTAGYWAVGAGTRGFTPTTDASESTIQMVIAIKADLGAAAEYLTKAEDTTDTTAYSFTTQPFGVPAADRYITVATLSRKAGTTDCTAPTVTIGGVSATLVVSQANNPSACTIVAIHKALVPTGTSGTIAVTYAATMVQAAIGVYRSDGTQTLAATTSGSSTATDPTGTLTIAANGYAIGAAEGATASSTTTWAGLTENYDAVWSGGTSTYSGAFLTPSSLQTGLTITADFTGAPIESAGVWAAWDLTASATSRSLLLMGCCE